MLKRGICKFYRYFHTEKMQCKISAVQKASKYTQAISTGNESAGKRRTGCPGTDIWASSSHGTMALKLDGSSEHVK